MELKVKDVYANVHYKGKVGDAQINEHRNNCKDLHRIGVCVCGERSCGTCFDTLITDIAREDAIAQAQQEAWDREDRCDGCNHNNCDDCVDGDEWQDEDGDYDDED